MKGRLHLTPRQWPIVLHDCLAAAALALSFATRFALLRDAVPEFRREAA